MHSKRRPAVFLDRDGTINREKHYLADPDDLQLLPGVIEGLLKLQTTGFRLVVVTNQSAIGRGLFDEERLREIHDRLELMLMGDGVRIAGWYYCPHVPADACSCRKPEPGMLLRAAADLHLDLERSWLIGDKLCDLAAGQRAGVTSVLVGTGYGSDTYREAEPNSIEYFSPTFLDAAALICRNTTFAKLPRSAVAP